MSFQLLRRNSSRTGSWVDELYLIMNEVFEKYSAIFNAEEKKAESNL